MEKIRIKINLVVNTSWPSLFEKIEEVRSWFYPKVELEFTLSFTNFTDIKPGPYGIDSDWYDQNLARYSVGHQIVLFLVEGKDWQGGTIRGFQMEPSYGAVELAIGAREDERYWLNGKDIGSAFFNHARHEILHALFYITGQPDTTHYWLWQGDISNALNDLTLDKNALIRYLINQLKVLWGSLLNGRY